MLNTEDFAIALDIYEKWERSYNDSAIISNERVTPEFNEYLQEKLHKYWSECDYWIANDVYKHWLSLWKTIINNEPLGWYDFVEYLLTKF